MAERQGNSPEFAFLYGGPGHEYYAWALYCSLNSLPVSKQPQAQAAPPAAPAAAPAAAVAPPPQQQPAQDTAAALQGLPAEVSSGWQQVLGLLNGSRDSIRNSQAWFMACVPYAAGMAEMMLQQVLSLADHQQQLHILYLANDILFKALSTRPQGAGPDADPVAQAFRPRLGRMLRHAYLSGGQAPDAQQNLLRVVGFWGERGVYERPLVEQLTRELMGGAVPAAGPSQPAAASAAAAAAQPPPQAPPQAAAPQANGGAAAGPAGGGSWDVAAAAKAAAAAISRRLGAAAPPPHAGPAAMQPQAPAPQPPQQQQWGGAPALAQQQWGQPPPQPQPQQQPGAQLQQYPGQPQQYPGQFPPQGPGAHPGPPPPESYYAPGALPGGAAQQLQAPPYGQQQQQPQQQQPYGAPPPGAYPAQPPYPGQPGMPPPHGHPQQQQHQAYPPPPGGQGYAAPPQGGQYPGPPGMQLPGGFFPPHSAPPHGAYPPPPGAGERRQLPPAASSLPRCMMPRACLFGLPTARTHAPNTICPGGAFFHPLPPGHAPPPEPEPEEPGFDPCSFPPGLIPRLVEDKLKTDPPYSPLSPLDIEAAGVPPPPKVDAYLKSRVDKFYAQMGDYRPGMLYSDIEVDAPRSKHFSDRGGPAAPGPPLPPPGPELPHAGLGLAVMPPILMQPVDDGSFGGPGLGGGPGGAGLGFGSARQEWMPQGS
ncbi:hypothetical protein CHLNCDRAFT_139903 [Chlorella variabilis]|uniref:CID domain-containing protein n=1 Tax=Chlorella variabilis TaxID=554065 RepID=E1ZR60_CHLVA|nr:hypothetical protein CHLNCDRAFT_139903 [Chlorella variabilis]EFN51673.1 hypothetical protein CHLNCDRAFT_139903 [Chlorella variabilis]|eukprot:XP_005843775.1 hypothetical protein CHLNCDRAFT_139903 [Chlorella variabilis]